MSVRAHPRWMSTVVAAALLAGTTAWAHDRAAGRVDDHRGEPVAGATVTIVDPDRACAISVYTDLLGRFTLPAIPAARYALTVTHPDHRTLRVAGRRIGPRTALALRLALEPDPDAHAGALAANRWLAVLLEALPDATQRAEVLQQCTACHQLGNPATRRVRSEAEWRKLLALMTRLGASSTESVRAALPRAAHAAFQASDVARRVLAVHPAAITPAPDAVLTMWTLDDPDAMLSDIALHPNGRVYAVDVAGDALHRFDPGREAFATFAVPHDDAPLGGDFAGATARLPANATTRRGPSSLAVAPDGTLWLTLAFGNRLARFDPATETWTTQGDLAGLFPTGLHIDLHGRLRYALALSHTIGLFDPTRPPPTTLRLPARTWLGALAGATGRATGARATLPVPPLDPAAPTGLDLAPDGGVWFSDEHAGRIGRTDPLTRDSKTFDTPFAAPRHLRCDSTGGVWVTDAASGTLARLDPTNGQFATWRLPTEPPGTDTASALAVGPPADTVWLAGANSDTLFRLDPDRQAFTSHPLPRGTVVRALALEPSGTVWGVTGAAPTWHGPGPTVLRVTRDSR